MNATTSDGTSPTKEPILAFSFLNEENTIISNMLGINALIISFRINPVLANLIIAGIRDWSVDHFILKITIFSIIGNKKEGMKPRKNESPIPLFFFLYVFLLFQSDGIALRSKLNKYILVRYPAEQAGLHCYTLALKFPILKMLHVLIVSHIQTDRTN